MRRALTNPVMAQGTPAFMAPEIVLADRPIDGRADLYSLACTACWVLTAQTLFEASTPAQMLLHHAQTRPLPPSQRSELPIPKQLEAILMKCLEKDPANRPHSALELESELTGVQVRRGVDNEAGAGMVGSALTRQRAVK